MLSLAIRARIPVIRAHTTDLLNLPTILEVLAPGMKVMELKGGMPVGGDLLLYALDDYVPTSGIYQLLAETGKVLVLINQGEDNSLAFNAGEVPVPKSLMEDLLHQVLSIKKVAELLPCFSGLTLKASHEIIRLVTAKDKALTTRGVAAMRAQLAGKLKGLGQVDTEMPLYICPEKLQAWINLNKRYFFESKDDRLIPRGILLNGDAGTGKSCGAKYIANEFGIPLYRLDISGALGAFVGESESAMARILSTIDQEENSVLLVDEVEKLFTTHEDSDSGVTARLLAQFLWWLSEHHSRVLVVMTCNHLERLPKELYRAGRCNEVITIDKLLLGPSLALGGAVLSQFLPKPAPKQVETLNKAIKGLFSKSVQSISQADTVEATYNCIKVNNWV